jgi:hypothetical protein
MENQPIIIWEKWIDPFGRDVDETKWTDYNNTANDLNDLLPPYDELDENFDSHKRILNNPIKVIASPLGLIPYNEHTASSKIFNFWLGHTNFNISNQIKDLIEQSEGIEILDIFTRYRFRIAIGKCFTDAVIMNNVNKKIYSFLGYQNDTN